MIKHLVYESNLFPVPKNFKCLAYVQVPSKGSGVYRGNIFFKKKKKTCYLEEFYLQGSNAM
jgi:hypothetical protein